MVNVDVQCRSCQQTSAVQAYGIGRGVYTTDIVAHYVIKAFSLKLRHI
ncbi:hypothetical protein BTN49_2003 [Candidatus Enterovibrio escicola]|uniref:Uncharacterized protein n=1 Tax=Candidatus Enterovibrio escicola TaxID=1927127 RepID=A0A2A5T2A0_9GAMM|nr:hypothetical protein BTN49_2003 [Candidatus Enterovibrio escacola]